MADLEEPPTLPLDDTILQLSSFDIYLPLPYRCIILINLGVWLWALNCKLCFDHNIDVLQVLKLQPQQQQQANKYQFKVPLRISLISFINYSVYLLLGNYYLNDEDNSISFLDLVCYFNIIIIFVLLMYPLRSPQNKRIFETFKRILLGNIDINLRNNDILLSDTLTSYSKVVVDLHILNSHLFTNQTSLPNLSKNEVMLNRSIGSVYYLDLLISCYPSTIRLRQCILEYRKTRNKQHLLNALKYSTSYLPVLATIYLKYNSGGTLFYWYLGSFINSTYSIIWDIMVDWNFEFFYYFLSLSKQQRNMLRSVLMFNVSFYYHVAIIIDFVLRYIWIIRTVSDLNSGTLLFSLYDSEIGLFVLEVLELLRRWVWVFIKLETEYIKIYNGDLNKIKGAEEGIPLEQLDRA